jgi:MFS family permease
VIATLAGGILVAVAFVAWELRTREPVLPMRMFKARAFSAGNAAIFCMFGAVAGAVFFMAQFLQVAQADSPLGAGVRLLPWTATLFVVAPLAGRQVSRIGERPLAAIGLAMQAVGMGGIALLAGPHVSYDELIAPLVIAGTGVSMAIPAIQNAVLGAVAPEEIGQASGAFNTMRQLGGAFGVAVIAAAFAGAGSYAGPQAFSDGFSAALMVSAGLSLAGAAAGALLPSRAKVVVQEPSRLREAPAAA